MTLLWLKYIRELDAKLHELGEDSDSENVIVSKLDVLKIIASLWQCFDDDLD